MEEIIKERRIRRRIDFEKRNRIHRIMKNIEDMDLEILLQNTDYYSWKSTNGHKWFFKWGILHKHLLFHRNQSGQSGL